MRIVQLTDLHLFEDASQTLLGVNTQQSFESVLDLLTHDSRDKPPDKIILTGDLSQDNSARSYERIVKAFEDWDCPIYWIPGNHDAPVLMAEIFNRPKNNFVENKIILEEDWILFLLNSHHANHVSGFLAQEELMKLSKGLMENKDKFGLVFLHHPPVNVGTAWLDTSGLMNAAALLKITDHYSEKFRGIICGHVHHVHEEYRGNVGIFSAPSTCIQFLPNQPEFALDTAAPGYRWIELKKNGVFKTGVERVKNYVNTANFSAAGY